MVLLEGRWDSLEDILPSVVYYNATVVTPRSSLQTAYLISRKQLYFWAHSFCNLKNWSGFPCRRCPKQLGSISSWAWRLDRTAKYEQACEHALHLRNIVKSRRARGTREETRKRRAGEWLSDCRELLLNKKNSRSLLSNFRRRRKLCPSRLRRSLARSLAVRFTRPNRRACSQAKYEPLVVSIEPEGTRTFQNRE